MQNNPDQKNVSNQDSLENFLDSMDDNITIDSLETKKIRTPKPSKQVLLPVGLKEPDINKLTKDINYLIGINMVDALPRIREKLIELNKYKSYFRRLKNTENYEIVISLIEKLKQRVSDAKKLAKANDEARKNKRDARGAEGEESVLKKLDKDVREKLNYYLRQNPKYNILQQQYNLLKVEEINYRQNGSADNALKCRELMSQINENLKMLKSVFSGKLNFYSAKTEEQIEILRNNPKLKELYDERTTLNNELKRNTPSNWVTKFKDLKNQVEIINNISTESKSLDFDDYLSSDKILKDLSEMSSVEVDFYNLCAEIGSIIDFTPEEIAEMKPGTILKHLKLNLDDTREIQNQIDEINVLISHEKSEATGTKTITNFMYEMFDYKTISPEDEAKAKEILALNMIGVVKSMAYKICTNSGNLEHLDEAVSAGLLGLTNAINKWFEFQVAESDHAMSFLGFAGKYVRPIIQRGLYTLTSKGSASGSTTATYHHYNNKNIKNFLTYNPEFRELPTELVQSLIDADIENYGPLNVVSQSDLISDNENDESPDKWTNATSDVSNIDLSLLTEAKLEYDRLIKSIKMLLNLFDDGSTSTSALPTTKKKLFNKYERKLFMMYFGLEYKKDKVINENSTKATSYYTQEEMARELAAMYRANGDMKNANYRQENLAGKNGKIAKLEQKIKFAVSTNSELKMALEYVYRYFMENVNTLEYLSNAREEVDMKVDRDELSEIFSDNEKIMNKQLTDGKRLSDLFELPETNPFAADIKSYNEIKQMSKYK